MIVFILFIEIIKVISSIMSRKEIGYLYVNKKFLFKTYNL